MSTYSERLNQLEGFKSNRAAEYKLAPIEKWMIRELGVMRIKKSKGSAIRYYHPVLNRYGRTGQFSIHRVHKGKSSEMISRNNFKVFLYHPLRNIIEYLEMESRRG